ncbi:GOLPH3/VPS74 family protein [Streptomyces palmae]|uniref:GPP34 family phosphoprotein n=1 Tax=Streptomyces palmae TaxID=1701085 RepID=A0A4Z0HB91_9ACTN|nr:GPP34 family phosphoprotein [Streptomyces palmae]TGB07819.1 GPP34 family phosphoprotein [Streptomyces palmae]
MTTPRDLIITVMDAESGRPVERGELSLALAGAELIDLLTAEAAGLEGGRIVPGYQGPPSDRLLEQAAASLVQEAPHETVEDWLWRRGRDLASAYLTALEAEGLLTREHHRWMPLRAGEAALADSLERRLAGERWATGEPVLAALGTALGMRGNEAGEDLDTADEAVEIVLAAVGEALLELEAVRQRRAVEQAAFDNIWRGD